jgi:hypothetical protein
MAFVPYPNFHLGYSFRDNNGQVSSTGLMLPGSLAFADANTFAAAVAIQLQALSDAYLTGYFIQYGGTNDAADPLTDSSEVERKLSLTFDAGTYKNAYKMEIPSPIFAIEQPRTDVADVTNTALATFIASMLNGPGGAGNGPRTYYGQDLTALARAVVMHRARKPRS